MSEPLLISYRIRVKPPLVGAVFLSVGETTESTLVCDGSLVPMRDYPELFEVMGHAYSRRRPKDVSILHRLWLWLTMKPVPTIIDEPEWMFRLPDLRGRTIK